MIRRRTVYVALGAIAIVGQAGAEETPPESPEATRIEDMVNRAAALVEKEGEAAFAQLRKRDSEWWFGNTYLFAYDQKLNVLLNPAFPQREGTHPSGERDANGKAFHDEFLKMVQSKGAGWVDYMFPRPGQTKPSQKWSYVKRGDQPPQSSARASIQTRLIRGKSILQRLQKARIYVRKPARASEPNPGTGVSPLGRSWTAGGALG